MHWCGVASRVNRGATRAQNEAGELGARKRRSWSLRVRVWLQALAGPGARIKPVKHFELLQGAIVSGPLWSQAAPKPKPQQPARRAFHTLDITELQLRQPGSASDYARGLTWNTSFEERCTACQQVRGVALRES